MHRLRLPLAVCACVLVTLPATAGARPGTRGFNATYPVASTLCARVAAGHAPKALVASTAQVAAACATLKSSFTNAQNAYTITVAPLRQQATTALAALRATCRQARLAHNPGACQAARSQTRTRLTGIRTQVRGAAVTYHASVDAARKAFWAAIHALRGAALIPADAAVGPGPVTVLPSPAAVNQA